MTLVCLDSAGAIRVSSVYQIYWGHSRSSEDPAFPSATWRRLRSKPYFHSRSSFDEVKQSWKRECWNETGAKSGSGRIQASLDESIAASPYLRNVVFSEMLNNCLKYTQWGYWGGDDGGQIIFEESFTEKNANFILVHTKCKLHCSTHSF